jgi:hypothetical protein
MWLVGGDDGMKDKKLPVRTKDSTPMKEDINTNDLFELCLKKGLIEKTPYGYYFKPEFFETLDIYKE